MSTKTQSSVREFALIGFLLLAVLFGMQIMSFIFGNMNVINTSLDDVSETITNETEAWVNTTGYTLNGASDTGATGFTLTTIWGNQPGGGDTGYNFSIALANATTSSVGVVSNLTTFNVTILSNVSLSYTYTRTSQAEILGEAVNNDSLLAIGNYASQSGTQFTTLGIAITLVVLVAVFIFFWVAFMGGGSMSGRGSRGRGSISSGEGAF